MTQAKSEFYIEVEGEGDLIEAAKHLARTDRGYKAMRNLLTLLDEGGTSLDHTNKEALLTLLNGAFGRYTMTARDAMREALGDFDD